MHIHHLVVIWDLESSVCHLQMKLKGSISHKYLHFATLFQLAIFSFTQSVLTSVKKARLRELIGEVKEEEPEGKAVVGPSREATTHSSGDTPPFSFFLNFAQKDIENFLFSSSAYPSHPYSSPS